MRVSHLAIGLVSAALIVFRAIGHHGHARPYISSAVIFLLVAIVLEAAPRILLLGYLLASILGMVIGALLVLEGGF